MANFIFVCIATILELHSLRVKTHSIEPKCSRFDYEEKLLEKMIRLEHETGVMKNTFKELSEKVNTELTIMKAGFSEMSEQSKGELAIMKTEFDTLKESVKEQVTNNLTNLEKGLQTIKENVSEQQSQVSKLITGEMDKLQAKLVGIQESLLQPTYAFSANGHSTSSPPLHGVLVFPTTLLDENGVYDNQTGKFTAPEAGVYIFHATLCTHSNKGIYVNVIAGGRVLGKITSQDKDYHVCSSGSAIARLQKGDQTFLEVTSISSGTVLSEDAYRMNIFYGHFISH